MSNVEGDDPEVTALRAQADDITNESLEATRRMRRMAEEARQMGAATNEALEKQGKQIGNVENELDKQNATMRQAEASMTEMEKFCGCCVCPWNKAANHESSKSFKKAYGSGADSSTKTDQPKPAAPMGRAAADTGPPEQGARMKRITNDAREDEMEENLNMVGDIVGDLRQQALAMNSELGAQNKQLDRVNNKMDSNIDRVEAGNVRATNILKNA